MLGPENPNNSNLNGIKEQDSKLENQESQNRHVGVLQNSE